MKCLACDGTGAQHRDADHPNEWCSGFARPELVAYDDDGKTIVCRGPAIIDERVCIDCRGLGYLKRTATP